MSQHFVDRSQPPQGLSSFTKIRLGWIQPHQAHIVKPRDTSMAFLSPLSKGGKTLVVKIPLDDGTYYLVENRQKIGYDKILPVSGILVLKVDPEAYEGYGTVKVQRADPSEGFYKATYTVKDSKRNIYTDTANGIAIIPLWNQKHTVGVLVTNPGQHTNEAVTAARAIQTLINKYPGKSEKKNKAIQAFVNKKYKESYAIATHENK